MNQIFLPGTKKQYNFFSSTITPENKNILLIGNNIESIATELAENNTVEIIVSDYASLITYINILPKDKPIKARLMEYDATDFEKDTFDLIYAQASVSLSNRVQITKEIKRILKPSGIYCVGEIVAKSDNTPVFIKNIWQENDIAPLHIDKISSFFTERNFKIIEIADLSSTLKDFYYQCTDFIKQKDKLLSEDDLTLYKKLLNRFSHESNAYLKHGGDKKVGFIVLIMEKV